MQTYQNADGRIRSCRENGCAWWQQCTDLCSKTLDWEKSTGGVGRMMKVSRLEKEVEELRKENEKLNQQHQ
jgi:hypothetical protein